MEVKQKRLVIKIDIIIIIKLIKEKRNQEFDS